MHTLGSKRHHYDDNKPQTSDWIPISIPISNTIPAHRNFAHAHPTHVHLAM